MKWKLPNRRMRQQDLEQLKRQSKVIDGMAIATGYYAGTNVGVVTTIAVVLHVGPGTAQKRNLHSSLVPCNPPRQSNGKIERWHKSLKGECIRPGTALSLDDARRLVECHIDHYNNARLNSAVGYITPKDMLAGRQREIHTERDQKSGWRENSDRFAGSRLRDTLWGHSTGSPLSVRWTGAGEHSRAARLSFLHRLNSGRK